MKTILCFFLLTLFVSNISFSQSCFIPAQITEYSTSVSNNCPNATGNDVKNDGSDIMRVNVWDGTAPTLGWYFETTGGPFIDTIHLATADSRDPDVTIQYNGTDWFALVLYYSATEGGVCMDIYQWIPASSSFLPVTGYTAILMEATSSAPSAVNIDGNRRGQFVAIWDNSGSDLRLWAGKTASSGTPGLSPNGFDSIPSSVDMVTPDVALFVDDHTTPQTHVNYTYINSVDQSIYIGTELFSDVYDVNLLTNDSLFHDDNALYYHPRIACPVDSSFTWGSSNLWSVAVSTHWGSDPYYNWDIEDFTKVGFPIVHHKYTDGSVPGLCDISYNENVFPAISYGHENKGFIIGWESGYVSSDPNFLPTGLVAIHCSTDGSYYSQGSDTGYMVLNPDIYDDQFDFTLSISGRDDLQAGEPHNIFYTYHYLSFTNDCKIKYKWVPWISSTLRVEENEQATVDVYPNPFIDEVNLKLEKSDETRSLVLSDISGRILFTAVGESDKLNSKLNDVTGKLNAGIYFLTITSLNDLSPVITKLVKL